MICRLKSTGLSYHPGHIGVTLALPGAAGLQPCGKPRRSSR